MLEHTFPAESIRRRIIFCCTFTLLAVFASAQFALQAQAQGGQTRLLRTPAVSATHIAFAYANNIWTVPRAGGSAQRITSFPGQTVNPHFSPDGKWIAFSGEYAGNVDAYVVATDGGEPRRLTWHPGGDLVQGWTPDGKSILFTSGACQLGAERRASLLDRAGCRRRGNAHGFAARFSRQDFCRWRTHRLSHE